MNWDKIEASWAAMARRQLSDVPLQPEMSGPNKTRRPFLRATCPKQPLAIVS